MKRKYGGRVIWEPWVLGNGTRKCWRLVGVVKNVHCNEAHEIHRVNKGNMVYDDGRWGH